MTNPKPLAQHCKESPKFRVILNGVVRGDVRYCNKTGKVNKLDAMQQLRNAFLQGRLKCDTTT